METFILKEEHLTLLSAGFFEFDGSCEFGSVGLDCKRPFGNSDVIGDMAKILGYKQNEDGKVPEKQEDEMIRLYQELGTAMNVIFSTKSFKLGKYKCKDKYSNEWIKE